MAHYHPLRQTQRVDYGGSDQLDRRPSAASDSCSYSHVSNTFSASRASTVSSTTSSSHRFPISSYKHGLGDVSEMTTPENTTEQDSPADRYRSMRQSLRPLSQAPAGPIPYATENSKKHDISPVRTTPSVRQRIGDASELRYSDSYSPKIEYELERTPSRSLHAKSKSISALPPVMTSDELHGLEKSSTSHLRTLSRLGQEIGGDDFSITSPQQQVAGMQGRRRLQRTDSLRATKNKQRQPLSVGWTDRNWMDKQRQFLQAYEYLCHIGEAKEWIERVIDNSLPSIVELEEALRDGVTLAEVVQAMHPEKRFKIFRSDKLQFRHSDNIDLFFRYLHEVELPELFRFEFIDLYEKKNIPKVIYCIHALSWLLFRKNILDFRIGNLVGQLRFEDHELEAMQKDLDKAGIPMPSFSGMSANFGEPEPEPEPVETEEERIDRELEENRGSIVGIQAQIRATMVRIRLADKMQDLWDAEWFLVDLQSRIRGEFAREIAAYHADMRRFSVGLQSQIRGFLARDRLNAAQSDARESEIHILQLQSLIRASRVRAEGQMLQSRMSKASHGVRSLQAAIRGALQRKEASEQIEEARNLAVTTELQAAIRGHLERRRNEAKQQKLAIQSRVIEKFQAICRAMEVREEVAEVRASLQQETYAISQLQAAIRAGTVRSEVAALQEALAAHAVITENLQSATRGFLARRRTHATLSELDRQEGSVVGLQSAIRGCFTRQQIAEQLAELDECSAEIIQLQASARAVLVRSEVYDLLTRLDEEEEMIEQVQSLARGMVVRFKFAEKQKYFRENMEKVVKVQSFVRARLQGEAYKSLTGGKNPPVSTIRTFVHLLNDSDFDFDEEIEFERMRKTVVQQVRQNEMAEQYIDQIDIKIALLVKNKITLDEVVKHQKHFGGHVSNLLDNSEMSSKDPFDLKALNKNSRGKLERYQQLFFALQTQPQYLSRLFKAIREQATPEPEAKKIEALMMGLFGYAQKRREEYYLLKVLARSLKEEIAAAASVQEYARRNHFWTRLFGGYVRSPKDRKFMREFLGPIVKKNIIENPELDLESDPLQIYKSSINNEELRTGQRSRRQPEIPREDAIRDAETRTLFIHHLQDLREIADQFYESLQKNWSRMPYGIRYLCRQIFDCLTARFPAEQTEYLLQVAANWVWQKYFQTALLNPEAWGLCEKPLSPLQKRNIGEVIKLVGQIYTGRLFSNDNLYLQPLNNYVAEAIPKHAQIFQNVVDVQDPEHQFDIDEFNDLYARQKPTLYIKMADIFSIHHLIAQEIAYMCPTKDDPMRQLVHELGSAKSNESEMVGVSNAEIKLTLNPKLLDVEDPDAHTKALFTETKRCILYIIRVQSGKNLMDVLVKPITKDDMQRWSTVLREEKADKRRAPYSEASTLVDIMSLTYAELKRIALENILELEKRGRITRQNHYQDLLNAIAIDIRTKHRRRLQRQREIESSRLTLGNLSEKSKYLDLQLKSYNDYIEQAMVTLQNKKGKKRFLLPFTRQYNHERELQRSGRVPKFGSFKYSAKALADKGVLVHYHGYLEKQYDKINLTISSDEIGIFNIEGSMGSIQIPGASARVPLDDLLQAQFNNHQFMNLFEGQMRLNVNLFLHLVFRKFYRDE